MTMPSNGQTPSRPAPSPLTGLIDAASVKLRTNALPIEVLHNLRYQHSWTEIQVHNSQSSSINAAAFNALTHNDPLSTLSHSSKLELIHAPSVPLLSGIPPRPIYIHPDFQAHLVTHNLTEADVPAQREWVLPMSVGEKWTLERFCGLFEALPPRAPLQVANTHTHQDAKRVLLAMVSHQGHGGDGTIVYYIMQEGDVKPRQN